MRASAQVGYVGDPRRLAQCLYELIQMARESIVLQMYLFAADGHLSLLRPGHAPFPYARTVGDWLIEKRRREPHVLIVVVLDTNTPDDPARVRIPGDLVRHQLERAGVLVLNANLFHTRFEAHRTRLPGMDFHLRWREHGARGWVARQQRWQSLHNVEDHRKNLVIDQGAWGAVTSHNLFDAAAGWHENLLLFDGEAAWGLWRSTRQALQLALEIPQRLDEAQRATLQALLSHDEARAVPPFQARALAPALEGFTAPEAPALPPSPLRPARVRVLDNEHIRPALEAAIERVPAGGHIAVATTYFSDLEMLERLFTAARRGVSVRVLIDDTAALPLPALVSFFVRQLVNRRVVETVRGRAPPGFELRIHASGGGTMMHLKTAAFSSPGEAVLIGGQANYTPNSFNGAWWETDVEAESPELVADFLAHFDALWRLPTCAPPPPPRTATLPWAQACLATLALLARCGWRP